MISTTKLSPKRKSIPKVVFNKKIKKKDGKPDILYVVVLTNAFLKRFNNFPDVYTEALSDLF